DREAAAIEDVFHEAGAREAGELALAAEGDDDLVGELLAREHLGLVRVVALPEFPAPVQTEPLGPLHLRVGMLGPRDRGVLRRRARRRDQELRDDGGGDELDRADGTKRRAHDLPPTRSSDLFPRRTGRAVYGAAAGSRAAARLRQELGRPL